MSKEMFGSDLENGMTQSGERDEVSSINGDPCITTGRLPRAR